MTTDYIHTRLEIVGRDYRGIMFGGADKCKRLENKCLDMDKA